MKPLNIFWVGIFLMILSGISKQLGWEDISVAILFAGIISIIGSVGAWMGEAE